VNDPAGSRSSRLLGPVRGDGSRSAAIAIVSTVLVFGGLALLVTSAPGWPRLQASFFNLEVIARTAPRIWDAFLVNVRIFLTAEVIILAFALGIAVMRGLPGPAAFPLRLLSVIYVDFFRGVPGILIVYVLGLGIPGLRLGLPTDPLLWGIVALVLIYSAYVSEVYRAGIESIHPSQEAAARSLGLSRLQSMRHVILPQAIRRVVPPLLNDFIGLQKDTALVALIGPIEAFRQSQISQSANFNFSPYILTALLFVIITVPMARFVDWLASRQREGARGGPLAVSEAGAAPGRGAL
jgi:polar amino acid transport system permease protein